MSLDGFVADPDDGVDEVFDWYFESGDVEFHAGGSDDMTFKVSEASAVHLRSSGCLPSRADGIRVVGQSRQPLCITAGVPPSPAPRR